MSNGQNALSEDQVFKLCKHFETRCMRYSEGLRDYLILSLMLHAGLRLGECMSLTWDCVMLEGAPLESVSISGFNTKSGKSRSVPMCSILKGSLTQYAKECHKRGFSLSGYVFQKGRDGKLALSHRAVQKFLEKESLICIGIPVHPHQLRHTFATRMMRLADLRTVQSLLGHSSVKSTQVYTHPDQEDFKAATNKLDSLNKNL